MDWFFKDINSHKKYSRPINIFIGKLIFEQLGTPTYSHIMDSLPERELKVNAIEELEFINMISTSVQQITLMLSQEKLDF